MRIPFPTEIELQTKETWEDFLKQYSSIQENADTSGAVDDDLSEALAFARQ